MAIIAERLKITNNKLTLFKYKPNNSYVYLSHYIDLV